LDDKFEMIKHSGGRRKGQEQGRTEGKGGREGG